MRSDIKGGGCFGVASEEIERNFGYPVDGSLARRPSLKVFATARITVIL